MDMAPGDILGFSGFDWTSYLINLGTFGWPRHGWSHVGIVGNYKGELLLFESTTMCPLPCAIRGVYHSGVQAQKIEHRIRDYHGRVYHAPLCKPLTEFESSRLTQFLLSQIGKPYDYLGAAHARATKLARGIRWAVGESIDELFCSEFTATSLAHIDRFETTDSAASPNAFARELRRDRITGKSVCLKQSV